MEEDTIKQRNADWITNNTESSEALCGSILVCTTSTTKWATKMRWFAKKAAAYTTATLKKLQTQLLLRY